MRWQSALTLILVMIATAGPACNRRQAEQKPRTDITALDPNAAGVAAQSLPEFQSNLENSLGSIGAISAGSAGSAGACALLDDMSKSLNDKLVPYSFIHNLQPNFVGGIEVAESPFTQMYLAEQFKTPTDDEFLAMAKAKYDKGELSKTEYYGLLTIKKMPGPLFENTKIKQVNKALEEGFPGIFGAPASLMKSLPLALAMKAAPYNKTPTDWSVLAKRLPLFISASWQDFNDDTSRVLVAAVRASSLDLSTSSNRKERLCSLVLWNRLFNQLLALKGYRQAKFTASTNPDITTTVPKLESGAQGFSGQDRTGSYIDAQKNVPALLTADDVKTYDPQKKLFLISSTTPALDATKPTPAGLQDSLAALESAIRIFEATSPGAPWISQTYPYLLGKIDDPKSPAILPADVHALALGLLCIQFKNLAGLNIVQVNAKGAKLSDKETAAGITLVDGTEIQGDVAKVRLSYVTALTRAVVSLENALDKLKATGIETIRQRNPLYDDKNKTIAKLLGLEVFTQKQLDEILSTEEQKSVMKNSMGQLQLPLAFLLLGMSQNTGKCVAAVDWNLKTGEKNATELCSIDELAEAKAALRMLALKTRSPLLFERSK